MIQRKLAGANANTWLEYLNRLKDGKAFWLDSQKPKDGDTGQEFNQAELFHAMTDDIEKL